MTTTIEVPKEGFVSVQQYRNQPVYFFRFDCEETENETILCKETTFALKNVTYENMVSAMIAVKYSIDAQLALLYNYQNDSEKYAQDMASYQQWRSYCKKGAQVFFGINE